MFKKLRLTTKLNLIVSLTLAVIIGLLGYINIVLAERQIIDTMVRSSRRIAKAMVDNLERYMPEREIQNMQVTMDMLVTEQQNIQKLMLINRDGRITLSTEKIEIGSVLKKQSHACNVCHVGSKHLVKALHKDLSKMVMSDSGQAFITVINPIYNKETCYTAP